MIQVTQLRRGMLIKLENEPFVVLSVTHITPGNWRGMVVCKIRSLTSGLSKEIRFRSTDRVEEADVEEQEMEYIYYDDGKYYFMDLETYEQIPLDQELLGESAKLLTPNTRVKVQFFEGKPFGVILPKTVVLKVIETQAYIKDATAQAQSKPAVLEGGFKCQVPPFIEVGDLIKIDTETGEYLERV
ncbi:MAG: elongation factor P [candidate division WOR-3 bacterium]